MRDIPGYEGLYAVTSCGKVWSYYRKKFIAFNHTKNGYLEALLSKGGVRKHYQVHRLVAMTYIPNPEGLSDVNHIDENKSNNCVGNLQWMSRKQNCNHGNRNAKIAAAAKIREENKRKSS